MPQISRPQMEPVTRPTVVNANPTSVTATAAASNLKFFVARKPTLDSNAAQAAVTAQAHMGT